MVTRPPTHHAHMPMIARRDQDPSDFIAQCRVPVYTAWLLISPMYDVRT